MINSYQRETHAGIYSGDASYSWLSDELQRAQSLSESLIVLCIGIKPAASVPSFTDGIWDAAIQQAALRIRTTIRMRDRIFHRQGDEVIVILPHTNIEGAITLVNRLIHRLTEQTVIAVPAMSIVTHIGGAVSNAHSTTHSLIQVAYNRMQTACELQRKFIFVDEPLPAHELHLQRPEPLNAESSEIKYLTHWLQKQVSKLAQTIDGAETQQNHDDVKENLNKNVKEIEARWPDIQQTLSSLIQQKQTDLALQLIIPVAAYCLRQNRIAEGLAFVESVLNMASLTSTAVYIQVMLASGELFLRANNLETAADRLHTAFTLATLPTNPYQDFAALALSCLALMYNQQGQMDYALSYALKAQELALNTGKPSTILLVRQRLLSIQASEASHA